MTFDEFDLHDSVKQGVEAMNFAEATPIQEKSIPQILKGRDIIACAQTGTGKTAAFVLPILSKLAEGGYPSDKVNAVIMSPTRELALQIDNEIQGFSYFLDVSSAAIYGGTGGVEWDVQRRSLELGADIIVATPGRLLSHINFEAVDLSQLSFFVLDEADRMLDMGFYDDIMQIFSNIPKSCQVIMFSATMPKDIRKLAQAVMDKPIEINISISKPPESIKQYAAICYENQKVPIIADYLKNKSFKRALIFASSKDSVRNLTNFLNQRGIKAREMHSDLDQVQREEVLRLFKAGSVKVLVATNIVSRGIDVSDIDIVINYEVPKDPEDYVHRIGRTARGDNLAGTALTFVSNKEQYDLFKIERFLEYDLRKLDIPSHFGETPKYNPLSREGKRSTIKNKKKRYKNKNKRGNSNQSRSKHYANKNRKRKNKRTQKSNS